LAELLIPLALVSVGAQLRWRRPTPDEWSRLRWGLGYKLLLAPAMIALLYYAVLGLSGEPIRVTVLEAAMGPMITGALIAEQQDLDPPFCSLMVSLGVPLCLLTVPLWAALLRLLGR
jgi:malate permease and related proteins